MNAGGITRRLVAFSESIVGRLHTAVITGRTAVATAEHLATLVKRLQNACGASGNGRGQYLQ